MKLYTLMICFIFFSLLICITASPGMATDEPNPAVADLIQVLKGETSQLDKEKEFLIVIRSPVDHGTKKADALSAKMGERLLTGIFQTYLGRTRAVVIHLQDLSLLNITPVGRSNDLPLGLKIVDKHFKDRFDTGYVISGTTRQVDGRTVFDPLIMEIYRKIIYLGSLDMFQASSDGGFVGPTGPDQEEKKSDQPAEKHRDQQGRLYVSTVPKDAIVRLEGVDGDVRQGATLSPGRYRLVVSAPGYEKRVETVWIKKGEKTELTLSLTAEKKEEDLEFTVIEGKNYRYEGYVKDQKRHGRGLMQHKNGDQYTGEWKNDKQHGRGTYTYSNGDKYEGEWKGGEMEGQGTIYFNSGNKYVGAWSKSVKHGRGIYYFKNGDKWEGTYKKDKREGQGIYTWADGESKTDFWVNGKEVKKQ